MVYTYLCKYLMMSGATTRWRGEECGLLQLDVITVTTVHVCREPQTWPSGRLLVQMEMQKNAVRNRVRLLV